MRPSNMEKPKKRIIIIIDDDKAILRILTRILQKQGYETDTSETGKEAMEKIGQKPYDLALIDIKLPDIEGIDLLPHIRRQTTETIMIMLTGMASTENSLRARSLGADAYLLKPVKPEELIKLVKEKLHE